MSEAPKQDPERLAHVQENFVRHMLALRGFVLGLVPNRNLADDIVQETFLVACQKAHTYQPGSNFRAWIFTIARFQTMTALRRKNGREALLSGDVVELLAQERPDDSALADRVAALDGCVGRLARTARRAVILRYSENLGPSDIARELGWTVNAINVALSRARIFLRQCVEHALRSGRPTPP